MRTLTLKVLAVVVLSLTSGLAVAQSSGTITFQGQIVADNGTGHDQYVVIQQTPGAQYPYSVYTTTSGRLLGSFLTQQDAEAFVQQASLSVLLS